MDCGASRRAPLQVRIGDEVEAALRGGRPLVALESAVATHGLPSPGNLEALQGMEHEIRALKATPATCLVQAGELWIGAMPEQVEAVVEDGATEKASVRDLGAVLAAGGSAGLTVSATLFAAQLAGIRVFATGGIGGVHRGGMGDVSADLHQLALSPVITVCAGAKSVLDIPRTLEYLETLGVPVFAYCSCEFPGFYLRSSGSTAHALWSVTAIVRTAQAHWSIGLGSGIVIGNPVPAEDAVRQKEWDGWLEGAERAAAAEGIHGTDLTPYLLAKMAEASNGRTVEVNMALLRQNARLAALIATELTP